MPAGEAHRDVGRGPVATVLVQNGTLRVGDVIVCGAAPARGAIGLNESVAVTSLEPPLKIRTSEWKLFAPLSSSEMPGRT